MNDEQELEAALRSGLARRAAQAPPAAPVAGRVLAEIAGTGTRSGQARGVPPWRSWMLPLVAAAAVAAVAGALVIAGNVRHNADHVPPAVSSSVVAPGPTSAPATTAPVTTSPPSPAVTSVTTTVSGLDLPNFRATDLSFVGPDDGFALGTANCLTTSGTCIAMARTVDGRTWHSVPSPPANVPGVGGCNDPCVTNLRFADDQIGYAYGVSAFFMTLDGGRKWVRQPGGADALETLSGGVIRLVDDHSGCPGPCNLRVQLAPNGSVSWTTVALPGGRIDTGRAALQRSGHLAFIQTFAGHAGDATPVPLYTSSDDGRSWTKRADPCLSIPAAVGDAAPFVSREIATAEDASVTVLCGASGSTGVLLTSTSAGRSFTVGPRFTIGQGVVGALAAASSTSVIVAAGDGIYRSTDSGRSWTRVIADVTNGGALCGFQSATVGRCTNNDRSAVWTTRDAGRSWSKFAFG